MFMFGNVQSLKHTKSKAVVFAGFFKYHFLKFRIYLYLYDLRFNM